MRVVKKAIDEAGGSWDGMQAGTRASNFIASV